MTYTCLHHGNVMLVAILNRQLVVDRSSRLNDCRDASLVGDLHTIREGEEGI